uniref:CRAL-TRIO domain-containing protein n=1 Tax=Trichuris muris TaxID=70415 RepID=A0A5S6Q403_TRIMR
MSWNTSGLCTCKGPQCGAPEVSEIQELIDRSIPDDMCTDFTIRRWWHAFSGDKQKVRVAFNNYIENAGFFKLDSLVIQENSYIRKLLPFFRLSTQPMVVNAMDNTIVLLVKPKGSNMMAMPKVLSSSTVVKAFVAMGEYCLAQILLQEARTKKESGVTFIVDCIEFDVNNLMHKFVPVVRMLATALLQFQYFYGPLIRRIWIVNAGSMGPNLRILLRLGLESYIYEKVSVIEGIGWRRILEGCVSQNALPVSLGGNWKEVDASKFEPLDAVTAEEPLHFTSNSPRAKPVAYNTLLLLPMSKCSIKICPEKHCTLRWIFFTSGNLKFSVTRKSLTDGNITLVYPRLILCTPLGKNSPEEDELLVHCEFEYWLEFENIDRSFEIINVHYKWKLEPLPVL